MHCSCVAATLAFLASASPASAQTDPGSPQPDKVLIPQDALQEQDPAGAALVDAFGRFCLDRFPGAQRVEDAAPGHVAALPPGRVRDYLHDDPGRGWSYTAAGGQYIVTIEDPPYHTCAVRRSYAAPPRYRLPWLLLTGTWAAAAGRGPFGPAEQQTIRRDGLVIEAAGRTLPGNGGDVFLELRTAYPDGHVKERLARRVIGR